MNMLLTGGTGFIGSHLRRRLENSGQTIRMLARVSVPNHQTIFCDFAKDKIPAEALDSVETVFHLAGVAHDTREASSLEPLYRAVNVDATVRLAEIAIQKKVRRFVFLSSVKAGGAAIAGRCMTEEDQGEPQDVYGKTKREAEVKLLELGRQSQMHVAIVRPALVYGPNVKGNLRLMLNGIEKGWFPPLPETGNRRSMIHVDDLVSALLLVANDARADGNVFIATDGVPRSSREIYDSLSFVLSKPVPNWSVPKCLFELARVFNSRARYKIDKLLGDECYSSEKLESLGFQPKCLLGDIYDKFSSS